MPEYLNVVWETGPNYDPDSYTARNSNFKLLQNKLTCMFSGNNREK